MRSALFTRARRQALKEATYAADHAARSEASRAWDSIIRYIETEARDDPPFHFVTRHPQTGGLALTYHDVPALPGDLGVILAPPRGHDHGALTRSRRGQFVILVYGALKAHGSTEYLADRIKGASYRKSFVHEYVHYLDTKRNPNVMSRGGRAAAASRAGRRSSYLQTPEEFNAWFQGTAQEIEDAVDREEDRIHRTGRRRNGEKFARIFLGHMHQRFATLSDFLTWTKTLSPETEDLMDRFRGTKWERKWEKRMATLYRTLKPRVMEMRTS